MGYPHLLCITHGVSEKVEPHTPIELSFCTDNRYRYGMNTVMPEPPPEDSEVTAAPQYRGSNQAQTIADGSSSSMYGNLAERRQVVVERCTYEAQQVGRTLLFGMTTSLMLQSVPLPEDCDLDASKLHTVSSMKKRRVRARASTLCSHIWKPIPQANKVRINQYVLALDLFHVWAQLASHISLQSLVILGDSIITAICRQPLLAQARDASSIYRDFVLSIEHMPKFSGRTSCVRALMLIRPGSDSPKESEQRLALQSHGIPEAAVNYVVPSIMFDSGSSITLDLAWPQYKVAVEYDGDHHRTDKEQWRRDQEKRGKLQGRGWLVFVATAASLTDDYAKAEFAFRVGRALTMRGAQFLFHLQALTLDQLAPVPRTVDWRELEARE